MLGIEDGTHASLLLRRYRYEFMGIPVSSSLSTSLADPERKSYL